MLMDKDFLGWMKNKLNGAEEMPLYMEMQEAVLKYEGGLPLDGDTGLMLEAARLVYEEEVGKAKAFVEWMEMIVNNPDVKYFSEEQLEVAKAMVAISRYNLDNPRDKKDYPPEEYECLQAAVVAYAIGR
jgi:hypothetical protein